MKNYKKRVKKFAKIIFLCKLFYKISLQTVTFVVELTIQVAQTTFVQFVQKIG